MKGFLIYLLGYVVILLSAWLFFYLTDDYTLIVHPTESWSWKSLLALMVIVPYAELVGNKIVSWFN